MPDNLQLHLKLFVFLKPRKDNRKKPRNRKILSHWDKHFLLPMNQTGEGFHAYCKQMMNILDFAVLIFNADLPRVNFKAIVI